MSHLDPSATRWLTEVALFVGAKLETTGTPSSLTPFKDPIEEKYQAYLLNNSPLAETATHKIYVCSYLGTNGATSFGVLKVAKTAEQNHVLDNEVEILTHLQTFGAEQDAKAYANGSRQPHYQQMMPRVVESFIPEGQDRRFVVLGFADAISRGKGMQETQPLSRLIKNGERVDVKTLTWMLTRALKLAYFCKAALVINPRLTPSNLLMIKPPKSMNPDDEIHALFGFDWTGAEQAFDTNLAFEESFAKSFRVLISSLIAIAGGDPNVARIELPFNPTIDGELLTQMQHSEFVRYLQYLLRGNIDDLLVEHVNLMAMSVRFWPKIDIGLKDDAGNPFLVGQFHPFETYPHTYPNS